MTPVLLALFASQLAQATEVSEAAAIRVGIVAFEDFHDEYEKTERLLAQLAEQHDPPLKFKLAAGTYGDVVHWINTAKIDVAIVTPGLLAGFLGERPGDEESSSPVEYLASIGKPAARSPLAAGDRGREGYHDSYRAACVVRADSSLKTLDDLVKSSAAGRLRLAVVHRESVSSQIAPRFALRDSGLSFDPAIIEYTHSHSTSLRKVAESNDAAIDVVAFVWDDALQSAPQLATRLRRLPIPALDAIQIPTDAVIARRGFPHAERLRSLLLAHVDEAGQHDFLQLADWQKRYAEVRRWRQALPVESAEADRVTLDEIGQLLLHHARSQPDLPRLALVLSGGGAKCAYQVGAVAAIEEMLAALREKNPDAAIDIELVVGTSGGAINAMPMAMGITRTHEGRGDFLDTWAQLDQRKIVRPSRIVRGNIGLWFALATTAVTLWLIRRYVPRHEKRGWVFGGIFTAIATVEIALRYLDLSPWRWLGSNHWLHHAWLWMSFGIGASAWSVLALGLGALFLQWRRVRQGSYLAISSRSASWMLAAALLGLPFAQVVTVLFFQETLSGGEGIERSLAEHFPPLINRHLSREALKPLDPGEGKAPSLQLRAVSRQIIERRLLRRDLVLTGSCLAQSTRSLPSDLYFFSAAKRDTATQPFGARGVSLDNAPGLLLDVVMGSGSIFPVFPSRRLDDFPATGEFVELVDGGFAHNSPIEAAVAWGATHVLLIEASPHARVQRENFLQNAAASFDHLYEQSQLLDTRARGKVSVFALAPESPHLCVLDFAENLIRQAADEGYRDASGRSQQNPEASGPPRFRKEPGEPIFATIDAAR